MKPHRYMYLMALVTACASLGMVLEREYFFAWLFLILAWMLRESAQIQGEQEARR